MPLHPSLISHGLVQDRTRSSALRVQYHSTNAPRSYHHHHHRHHWLDSPWWALAFLRSFAHSSLLRATFFQFLTPNILILRCRPWQIGPVLTSSDFVTIFFSRGGVVSPTPNPQQSWRTVVFLSGLSPLADQP